MKCAICGVERSGYEHILDVSGKENRFFICDQCETEKGKPYDDFFDNVRENAKQKEN
jgi:ribosome-binding protein aMBF1 (putative translation factor)